MSKNNLDKLGLVSNTSYSQDALRSQFAQMRTSSTSPEFHNIPVIYLDGDKEITTQINLQEGLKAPTAANSSTNSEREFPTTSNLQESIKQ